MRRPRDATLVNTWDLDTDRGVSQLLASNGRQLVVVPTNKGGLTAALWLRREVSRLGVLDVPLLVGDTANLCGHVKVPCAYTVQCTESRGSFARVLCAKLFALARLFMAGADVFVMDSDAAVLSAEPFQLWRGPMRNASMICQHDSPFLNSGMMRMQHVGPLADATVGWLLDEWLHRVRLISNATGYCGGCDQSVLNELVSGCDGRPKVVARAFLPSASRQASGPPLGRCSRRCATSCPPPAVSWSGTRAVFASTAAGLTPHLGHTLLAATLARPCSTSITIPRCSSPTPPTPSRRPHYAERLCGCSASTPRGRVGARPLSCLTNASAPRSMAADQPRG